MTRWRRILLTVMVPLGLIACSHHRPAKVGGNPGGAPGRAAYIACLQQQGAVLAPAFVDGITVTTGTGAGTGPTTTFDRKTQAAVRACASLRPPPTTR